MVAPSSIIHTLQSLHCLHSLHGEGSVGSVSSKWCAYVCILFGGCHNFLISYSLIVIIYSNTIIPNIRNIEVDKVIN
jgi:hypothetical protein